MSTPGKVAKRIGVFLGHQEVTSATGIDATGTGCDVTGMMISSTLDNSDTLQSVNDGSNLAHVQEKTNLANLDDSLMSSFQGGTWELERDEESDVVQDRDMRAEKEDCDERE